MYTGDECMNCKRIRVELIDDRRICEKCNWNQDTQGCDNYVREKLEKEMEEIDRKRGLPLWPLEEQMRNK